MSLNPQLANSLAGMSREEAVAEMLRRARATLGDIDQYFNDVDHWNDNRGRTEGLIERDPGGQMARLKSGLEKFIAENSKEAKAA